MSSDVVLVGFAEALSAMEAVWSLQDAGFQVAAFTRRGARPPAGRCDLTRLIDITAPEESLSDASEELARACVKLAPAALLPLDDASLFLCDAVNAEHGVPVAGATADAARLALDKSLQLEAARSAGLSVPDTQILASRADVLALDAFPLVLKPALAMDLRGGRLGRDGHRICATRGDLEAFASRWDESARMLAQPFCTGTGEGVFGLATADGVVAWSGHRRVRMMNPAGSGSSACRAVAPEATLREAVERFVSSQNWRGMFMVELLRDEDGTPWFMELNGRSWGSMALARRQGLEYPAWTVMLHLDPAFRPDAPPVREGLVCRHLGREIVHLLHVLRGPRGPRPPRWPGRWRTMVDLVRGHPGQRYYNWRSGDTPAFLADTWQTVKGQIFRPGRTG